MTIRLPFIASIRKLARDLMHDKSRDLNWARTYEIEILPSSMLKGRHDFQKRPMERR